MPQADIIQPQSSSSIIVYKINDIISELNQAKLQQQFQKYFTKNSANHQVFRIFIHIQMDKAQSNQLLTCDLIINTKILYRTLENFVINYHTTPHRPTSAFIINHQPKPQNNQNNQQPLKIQEPLKNKFLLSIGKTGVLPLLVACVENKGALDACGRVQAKSKEYWLITVGGVRHLLLLSTVDMKNSPNNFHSWESARDQVGGYAGEDLDAVLVRIRHYFLHFFIFDCDLVIKDLRPYTLYQIYSIKLTILQGQNCSLTRRSGNLQIFLHFSWSRCIIYQQIKTVKPMNNHSGSKLDGVTMESRANFGNSYYEGPSQQDINVKEHHIIPPDSQRPTDQDDGTCKSKIRGKKWLILVICAFVVFVGIIAGIAAGIYKNFNHPSQITPPSPTPPTPTPTFGCENFPTQCNGVPQNVQNYIFATYTSPNQISSMLQVSRSLSAMPSNSTTRSNYVGIYRDLLKSTQCLSYNVPTGYAQAYQDLLSVQLQDQTDLQRYLEMSEAFSGQPFKATPTADLPSTCSFTLTASNPLGDGFESPLQVENCTVVQSLLVLFHGIGYSPSSSIENLRSIENAITAANNNSIVFDGGSVILGAYRNEDVLGFFTEVVAAYQQKQRSQNKNVSSQLAILKALRLIIDHNGRSSKLPSGFTSTQYQELADLFLQRSVSSFIYNQSQYSMDRHKNFLTQNVLEGKKIVIVAHGEATLYVNFLYNLLSDSEKNAVGLIFIGPLADSMADNSSSFITNPNDRSVQNFRQYINQVGNFTPPPLPSNVDNTTWNPNLDFGMNHALQGYLAHYAGTFVGLIGDARNRTVQPPRTLGSGPITVVLTWDDQPDLDLHVFEPNFHVYYSSSVGHNGVLDLDDTNGYGPEHYYTSCTIEVGNYTPKVNYYGGSRYSLATVTVSAGSEYFVKELNLTEAAGGSGDADPAYTACTVTVSRSPYSGSYIFKITQ